MLKKISFCVSLILRISLQQLEVDSVLLRDPVEGRHILGEARTAVAKPRAQKLRPNPAIHAHARRNVLDVRVHSLGQVRHGIDERDLQRQEGI